MLNDDVDELDANGDACINRKLQPVAVKILHPGIKGQLRYEIYQGVYNGKQWPIIPNL